MTVRFCNPLPLLVSGAIFLAILWASLLLSPGWLPVSVNALTFGLLSPAIWEISNSVGQTQTIRYVESPNSLVFILSLFALSGAGLYFATKRYLGNAEEGNRPELSASQRELAKDIRAEGLRLDEELVQNIKWIQTFLRANEEFSRSLKDARTKLERSKSANKTDVVITFLLAKNSLMQKESADLKQRLTTSQQQIEELRAKLAHALDQGMRDPLTELGNRRRFDITLAQEAAQAQAKGSKLSLVICDLDHFKHINDKFGHQVGDSVLQLFASLLVKNIKGRDTAIRYGGEEFALILPETGIEGAKHVTENIRSDLEASSWRVTTTRQPIGKITASFGLAELKTDEDIQQLIKRADRHLYIAKESGRNRVEHNGA
ncbi:diguanylate cyclase [Filomicrobium insigne]|uniref:diguanylate cyclase n=1 Tax=Filomicrobium insigne TaxID=418854 RepID=A0A1H0NSF0_9HYPH|nr:diguanylate cyclase [Filomicrobium insigne]SDO95516.1 diguanylate cyclase [Filomicrobium insigne]